MRVVEMCRQKDRKMREGGARGVGGEGGGVGKGGGGGGRGMRLGRDYMLMHVYIALLNASYSYAL